MASSSPFRGWLVLPLVALACSSAEPRDDLDSPDGGTQKPELIVGTGDYEFVATEAGSEVPIIAGVQGGFHIPIAVRVRGLSPELVELSFGIRDAQDGRLLSVDPLVLKTALEPSGDGWFERFGLLGILDVPVSEVAGKDVILWAVAEEPFGDVVTGELRVRAVAPGQPNTDGGVPPHLERTQTECDRGDQSRSWKVLCADSPVGHFLSVWGSGPDDVYAVGGVPSVPGVPGETAVFHWNGTGFDRRPVDGSERAWWVFGLGDRVWVVGERGLGLVSVRGGPFEPFDTKTDQTIFGMWGASEDEVYFVTGDFGDPDARGRVHTLTSSGAAVVQAPALDAYEGQALFKVWGTAKDDVFVSGDLGAVFHFDGSTWTKMTTPDDKTNVLTLSGRSASELYAVGGRGVGKVWQSDGVSWSDVTPGIGSPGLMGVHTSSRAEVLLSGENGFLATLAEGGFDLEGTYTELALHAVWQDAEDGAWAVGGNLFAQEGEALGVVLRRPVVECEGGISGPGFHHLDLQGRGATPLADGSYPMFDEPRGTIHPDLVHGEHYLLGAGSFVDFTIDLCDDITDEIGFRIPNNDEPGAVALHELFIVRDDQEILVASAVDSEPGSSGYLPFDRSSLPMEENQAIAMTNTHPGTIELGWGEFANAPPFETAPRDILARKGDKLLFRTTNISDKMYGLMVWFPQNGLSYQAFLEVHVPDAPGGEPGMPQSPPPEPGPCAPATASAFVELGTGESTFVAFPPNEAPLELGPQGSLMFLVAVRGRGFDPGDPLDPSDPTNPRMLIRLALDAPAAQGGRIVADGSWQRGFETVGSDLIRVGVRPTVPVGAAQATDFVGGQTIYAELKVVDATSGLTLCQDTTLIAAP